jgi:hypothetical protein
VGADEIRRELEAARADARRLADEQQAWRAHVAELFDRALAAGLTVEEIVESLGLSAKWTAHRRRRVARRFTDLQQFFYYGQQF